MLDGFLPIIILIKKSFPEEKIISQRRVFDANIQIFKLGRVPLSLGFGVNLPFPARLIETDSKFYIDRRVQRVFSGIFIDGLLFGILFYFLFLLMASSVQFEPSVFYRQFIIGAIILVSIFNIIISIVFIRGYVEIINKSWISKTTIEGKKISLLGNIPEKSNPTFSNYINSTYRFFKVPFKYVFYSV